LLLYSDKKGKVTIYGYFGFIFIDINLQMCIQAKKIFSENEVDTLIWSVDFG
jgi:hypothetical protein